MVNNLKEIESIINKSGNFRVSYYNGTYGKFRDILIYRIDLDDDTERAMFRYRVEDFSIQRMLGKARENLYKKHFVKDQIEDRELLLEELKQYDRAYKLDNLLELW